MTFQELGLNASICKALAAQGYKTPTPIQSGAIPPAVAGRDVLGIAQTGTGKTCAFATPILQRLAADPQPGRRVIRSLILTPTRELALQIQESFEHYGRETPLRSTVIFGGVGQAPQVERIRQGVDILVATPGRLLDLQGQGLLDLSHIGIFVLDEADRMLDMGFIHDVRRVLKLLPAKKQTLFFSATMPPEVMGLVKELLHDYARVAVTPVSSPVEVIDQSLYYVDKPNKTKLLAWLVSKPEVKNALVFSRTKHGANKVAGDLVKAGIAAAAIHGNKSQTARVQALTDFKAGRIKVLVATDIAARGLDIEELSHVFNYNLPDVPETYVHRIGRTGRAGHGGTAVSFCDISEKEELKGIEKLLGKPVPVVEGHPWPMENFTPPQRDKHGKIINPEDAEARQAAREKKKARDESRREAGVKADPAPAPVKAAPSPAPAKAAPVKAAPSPAPAKAVQKPPVQKPASKRGVRLGDLDWAKPKEAARPAAGTVSGGAPAADRDEAFRRWMEEERRIQAQKGYTDPLAGDTVMDATARLLAPRRPVQEAGQAQSRQTEPRRSEARTRSGSRRQEVRPSKAGSQRREGKPAPQRPEPPRVEASKSRASAPVKAAPAKAAPVKASTRPRKNAPREFSRPRTGGQLDSTEHQSLMKPYYLNED